MTKDIFLLGSTGSIGQTTLNIIRRDKNNFNVKLLTTNKNVKKIYKQAIEFKVKNIVISNKEEYLKYIGNFKKKRINVFFSIKSFLKENKKKSSITINAISGIDGLEPTLNIIKYSKNLAIANKESIICGWNFINKELRKYKTRFIPLDSEHFSIWSLLKNEKKSHIKKIYLTASGGPFLNKKLISIKNVKPKIALNHPNWKMGKKISIDSATMINKIYEVIEAKNIFNIPYQKIHILVHPKSYIHAIIKFKNGLIKIIAHDTTMKIPIFNTIYSNTDKTIKSDKLNINLLNNLNLRQVDKKRYPIIKLLNLLPNEHTLFDTVIVSTNDILVELFLKKRIKFIDIEKKLLHLIKSKVFLKYKKIYPSNTKDIINLNKYVRLKVLENMYKSAHV